MFVKGATDARTATWLRTEYQIYSQVRAPFVPTMRAWQDNGALPFMALEDLSDAVWQAPWTPERVTRVRETLKQVAATPPPAWLPTLEERRPSFSGWAQVERATEPFLRLGLCSAGWLASSVAALVAAEAAVQLGGDELVHGDVRSDNLCFVGDRVVLVDWNWASRGNAIIDVAGWLTSLGWSVAGHHSARAAGLRGRDQRLLCRPGRTSGRAGDNRNTCRAAGPAPGRHGVGGQSPRACEHRVTPRTGRGRPGHGAAP